MPTARNGDLALACGWALVTLAVVGLTDSVILRVIVSLPLLLFLTGHTILRALGPIATSLLEHVAYAVGASIAICLAGGFVLNRLGGLTPLGWAAWLAVVTIAAAIVARIRHGGPRPALALGALPPLRRWHALTLVAAVLITGGAYGIAVHAAATVRPFKYVEFWMVPGGVAAPNRVIVGIHNAEAKPLVLDVEVKLEGHIIASWRGIAVAPGVTWARGLAVELQSGQLEKVRASLYSHGGNILYRQVSAIMPAG